MMPTRHASILPSLAECLKPGFARHRALSRAPRAWRAALSTSQSRHNDAGSWGEAAVTTPTGGGYEVHSFPDAKEPPAPQQASSWETSTQTNDDLNIVPGPRNAARGSLSARGGEYSSIQREVHHWQKTEQRLQRNEADHNAAVERERRLWQQPSGNNTQIWDDYNRTKLPRLTVPAIYQKMRTAASRGMPRQVQEMAAHLLQERDEVPNVKIYACLILSHIGAVAGSAHWVKSMLAEMREERIGWDSGICHDVLKVLAVHPDLLLREQILSHMKSHWFTLSTDGQHDVATSLLREGQLELGIERIEELQTQGATVQPWLHDIALHILCNAGEVEEALRLLQSRIASPDTQSSGDVSPVIWWRLLESATASAHYDAARYVWNRRVRLGYLNPPSGVCLSVLKLAARRGDVDLATDVFRVMGERATVFSPEHYELLMEAYIQAKDLHNAFSLLCVMYDTNASPDLGTARGLVYHFRRSAERRAKGLSVLENLARQRTVPILAMNALIEGAVAGNALDEALEYYKCMQDICVSASGEGPARNVDTFNILLRGCRSASRKEIAMFLASEMVALKIKPNALTYDRLVLICLKEVDFEDAFGYYFEMLGQGFKPRLGTLFFLARKAADAVDSRTERLLKDMEAVGEMGRKPVAWVREKFRMAEERQRLSRDENDSEGTGHQVEGYQRALP